MPLNFIAKALVTVALSAAQMALTASQTIEGPRLNDLRATTANPGDVLPNGLGRVRNAGICFFAEPIKEKKKKHKTKGGKYKEYTYFGTWAVMIADHAITRVRRIWFDNHLVYDATGVSVVSVGDGSDTVESLDGNNTTLASLMRIYTGTQSDPDPRMLAYLEAKRGVGTCPAYLDVSYLMMEDVPLAKVGNRLPQVDIEYDGIGGEGVSYTRIDSYLSEPEYAGAFNWTSNSPDGRYAFSNSWLTLDTTNSTIEFVDPSVLPAIGHSAIDNDGTIYALETGNEILKFLDFGNGAQTSIQAYSELANGLRLFVMPDDSRKLVAYSTENNFDVFVYDVDTDTLTTVTSDSSSLVSILVQDMYSDVWAIGSVGGDMFFQRVVNNGAGSAAPNYNVWTGGGTPTNALHTGSGWVVTVGTSLYLLDEDDFSVIATRAYGGSYAGLSIYSWLAGVSPGTSQFWLYGSDTSGSTITSIEKINATSLATIESHELSEWEVGDTPTEVTWLPAINAIVSRNNASFLNRYAVLRYFTGGEGLSLDDVCRHFSGLVGLTETGDYIIDSPLAAIPVTGYGWTQQPAKSSLDFLLPLHDCELRTHDGIPQFIARGGTVGTAIDTPEFIITEGQPEGRFKLPLGNEADVPRQVVFTFADVDADLQPNTAKAQRNQAAFDGHSSLTIDGSTLALNADDADAKINRWFRRQHFSLQKSEHRLSMRQLAIECGDLVPFIFDGLQLTMHVDKITDSADGSRHFECSIDDPSIAALSAISVGAPAAGRPPSEIFSPGQSTGFVLDLPLLSDAHDQAAPFVYFTGGPSDPDASYVGTEFSASDTGDDDTFATWDATSSSEPATFGETTSSLPDALPWVIDYGSSLNVLLTNGTLSSITEAQMLDSGTLNLALVGDELIQFRTATLTAPLTYTLSGFVRGARGTEQHIAAHTSSDRFVLLDTAARHTLGAGELGDEDWYVAAAAGAEPNEANKFALDFNGNAHKPYSPVNLEWEQSGADWLLHATRRTRIGGASLNGQDVPLGESSEAWEVDIYDGADVVRTIAGTSLPLTYSSGDQTIDFGSPLSSPPDATLYQIDPTLTLRGFGTAI